MKKKKNRELLDFSFFALLNEKEDNKWINEKARELYKIDLSEIGSTKFRTDEKGHELKAHDSFF